MKKRLKQLLIKEFHQMLRDPRMRAMIFFAPVLQMIVFSYAITNDVMNIRMAVLDNNKSVASRELIDRFASSRYFKIAQVLDSDREIDDVLDRGTSRVVLNIPSDFEENIISGKTAVIQILADGTDSNTTSIVFAYSNTILGEYMQDLLIERFGKLPVAVDPPSLVKIESRAWYNHNLESRYYFVPSVITLMLILIGMILASISIVREKETGTIEQIMVTPVGRFEFILGKTIPYLIVGYIVMTLMLVIMMLIFGVYPKGNLLFLYIMAGVYITGNLGLALFISTTASTQQQALLTSFFILMPAVLLSGFIMPVANMPPIVQYATWLNPMRWFMDIIRGVIMKGAGPASIIKPVIGQTCLAVLFIGIAALSFRKTAR
jgi:ABC-2 type transport system permease protein